MVRTVEEPACCWTSLRKEIAAIDKELAIERGQEDVPGVTLRDILTFNWLIEPRLSLPYPLIFEDEARMAFENRPDFLPLLQTERICRICS